MYEIKVNTSKSYIVYVGENILKNVGKMCKDKTKAQKALIVTDNIVEKLYYNVVANSLKESGFQVFKFVIPNGELSKNLNNFCGIINFLAVNGFTRTDLVVALGGGVVGDLAGFSAASYMRGIDFVQIPTTILSQIDSSVGGKTGVDLDAGKNLVGAFWQPKFVLCDIETTKTLPQAVFDDGLGEMAKYGILCEEKFYNLVAENNLQKNLLALIILSIEYKRDIVEIDEFEHCERKFLNLGHTVAHGIEKLSNFTITHGKAVGIGLFAIAKASKKYGMLNDGAYSNIEKLLRILHQEEKCQYNIDEIFSTISLDKKCEGSEITLVLIKGIGNCVLKKMDLSSAKEFLK